MGIADALINAGKTALELIAESATGQLGPALATISSKIISTPHPLPDDALFTFSPPESGIWASLWGTYQYMLLITTALMIVALAMIMLSGTYSNDAKARRSLREVLFWYPISLSWWWIGGIFLKFTHVTTQTILDGAGAGLSFIGGYIAGVAGGIVIALLIYFFGWSLLLFVAVVYYARWALIHIFHVLMPPLLMLRVFPFQPVQSFADSIVSKYPPIVLTTIPVSIMLRIGIALFEYPDLLGGTSFAAPFLALTILIITAILPKFTLEAAGTLSGTAKKSGQIARGMATGGSSAAHDYFGTAPDPEGGQQTLNSGVDANTSQSGSSGSGSGSATTDGYDKPDPHSLDPNDMNFASRGRKRRNRRGAKLVTSAYKAGKQIREGGLTKPFSDEGEIGGNSGVRLSKAAASAADEKFTGGRGADAKDAAISKGSDAVDFAAETARESRVFNRSEAAQMDEDDINRDASFDDFEDTDVGGGESSEEGVWADLDGVEDSAAEESSTVSWGVSDSRAGQMVRHGDNGEADFVVDEEEAEQAADELTDQYNFEEMDSWAEADGVVYDEMGLERGEENWFNRERGEVQAAHATKQKIQKQTDGRVPFNIPENNFDYEFGSKESDGDTDDAPEPPPMWGSGGTAAEGEQTAASGASTPDPEPPSPDELQTEETSYSDLSKPTAHEVATNRDTSELSEAEAREEFESRFTEMDHNGDVPPTDADIENGLDALEEHPTSNFEREDAEETASSQSGDTPAMVGTDADPMVEEEQTVSESRAEAVDNQYVGLSGQSTTPSSSEQAQTQTTTSGGGDSQSAQNDLEPHQEAVQEHLETTKQSAEEVSPVEVAGKLATEDDRVGEPNEVTDYVKQLQED